MKSELSLPKKHGCGRVYSTYQQLLSEARFDGLQELGLSGCDTDAFCFTCKCGSSFLVDAKRRFSKYEIDVFFMQRRFHMERGDASTWRSYTRQLAKTLLTPLIYERNA